MREMSPEGEEVIKIGKLYLVDLAGSENVNRCARTQRQQQHPSIARSPQACAVGSPALRPLGTL